MFHGIIEMWSVYDMTTFTSGVDSTGKKRANEQIVAHIY